MGQQLYYNVSGVDVLKFVLVSEYQIPEINYHQNLKIRKSKELQTLYQLRKLE